MQIKDMWLWIFEQESNKELSLLCTKIGATIQGFRNNKVTDKNRGIVIRNLVTPKSLSRICEGIHINEVGEKVANLSIEELILRLEQEQGTQLLKMLLVKGEEEKALALFQHVVGAMEKMEIQSEDIKTEDLNEIGKVKKLEKKLEKLKRHSESEIARLKEKNHLLSQEIERLNQQLLSLKHEKGDIQKQATILEEERNRFEVERRNYQKKIEEYKSQYGRLHAKIAHLEAQILDESERDLKKIALIGNPHNDIIYQPAHLQFHVFEGDEIEGFVDIDYEEIWLLLYKVPLARKRQWLSKTEKEIQVIQTFSELLEKLEVRQ